MTDDRFAPQRVAAIRAVMARFGPEVTDRPDRELVELAESMDDWWVAERQVADEFGFPLQPPHLPQMEPSNVGDLIEFQIELKRALGRMP